MRVLLWIAVAGVLCAQPRAVSVDVDSVVHPVTVEVVRHALEKARRESAEMVLIRLNTPGGMMEASRQVVELLTSSTVPVVTLVGPGGGRAASAGFFLLLAGDVAAMTEGTHTGAASPVLLGQPMEPVMRKKVESDAAAWVRSLAVRRGKNAATAEKAVFEAKSFTSAEALQEKLIDVVVRDEADLWTKLDGREVARSDGSKLKLRTAGMRVAAYPLTMRERAVTAIADPNLAFLFVVLGGLLLYVEFTNPGIIVAGVSGAILLLVGLMALSVLPISGTGVALLLLAVGLFVAEAKVASHGVLGVGGVVAMVLGAMLLVEGPPEMRIQLSTALAVSLPFAAIVVFLVTLVVKARLRAGETGAEGMMRETGVALTDLSPAGTVRVHGERWNAESATPIQQGAAVRVVAIEGLRLTVAPAVEAAKKE